MTERQEIVKLLLNHPVKIAHKIGLTKLKEGLHDNWIKKMLLCKKEYTLQGHRGSYKTSCVALAIAILIILKPNEKILFIRKTATDAQEIIKQVAKILKTEYFKALVYKLYGISDFYLTVENSYQINTNLNKDVLAGVQLEGAGIELKAGRHFTRIFADDITNLQDRLSRAEREHTKVFYQELKNNILTVDGSIVNTNTPWHPDDCASLLMKNKEMYDVYSTGILSEEEIKQKEQDLEDSLFACNYLLKFIKSSKVIFTNPVINGDERLLNNGAFWHIDAAYGGEDGTALTILKKIGGKFYIFGRLWHKDALECLTDIKSIQAHFNSLSNLRLEDNGDKGLLAKEFRRNGIPTSTYHESRNKHYKIISLIKPVWKDIIFVNGTSQEYINEICDYYEGIPHDDAADSLACCIDYCNNFNIEYNSILGGY